MPKRGRPKLEFDLKQIKLMGQFRATYETMADWFECSSQTIQREMERNPEFSKSYKKGLTNTKMKIAEAQVHFALKGNPTLLIWLGKQYLDQREPKEYEASQTNWTTQMKIEGLDGSVI